MIVAQSHGSQPSRLELAADAGWRFAAGDANGAEAPSYHDSAWRVVNLPHDWSIEGTPDRANPTGSGGGYFPAGIGWYRRTFRPPAAWKGQQVSVEFDGVYRDATVYLNGRELGRQPYGYTTFRLDLTAGLDFEATNVLAVRVDNSAQPNSRWYSGSGIYRHVRVVVTDPVYVAHWGVFVTTPAVSTQLARVAIRTRVANESSAEADLTLRTTLRDAAGRAVGTAQSTLSIDAAGESEASQEITVRNPALWSPESPVLYRAVTQVLLAGKLVDEVVTPFGIRSIRWSAEHGLQLNGRSIKLTGGSVHHDHGPLGAAAFDRAEERRVELLKAAGHNAVRTAHNPPSPAFLDACDRLGLLVLDEAFDTWKVSKAAFDYGRDFDDWWRRDLSAMVLRDRNHPSIVMWGIGNEIPEVYTDAGGPLAKQLASLVRSLDDSRPITQAFPGTVSGPTHQAVFESLDVVGYNYNLAQSLADDHRRAPGRIMLTTESYPGDGFEQWRLVNGHPFVVGEFVWTAIDYLGESGIGAWGLGTPAQASQAQQRDKIAGLLQVLADRHFIGLVKGQETGSGAVAAGVDPSLLSVLGFLMAGYPWHASYCGDLDLTGWRKPQSYYRDILWNGGDRVYATVGVPEPRDKRFVAVGWAVPPTLASWTWPGHEGQELRVEVYSAAETVRLSLNGRQIGEWPTGLDQQRQAVFAVPYEPGTLKVEAVRGGRVVSESVLATAGPPTRLRLTADRSAVRADGQDLSFVTVEAVDADGRLQPNADFEVQFSIAGPGTIAAVGNGDGRDGAPHRSDRCKLFQGRALVVVRTSAQPGSIPLTAAAHGLIAGTVTIDAKAAVSRDLQ